MVRVWLWVKEMGRRGGVRGFFGRGWLVKSWLISPLSTGSVKISRFEDGCSVVCLGGGEVDSIRYCYFLFGKMLIS